MTTSSLPEASKRKAAEAARKRGGAVGRSAARLLAVQALYQIAMTGETVEHVLPEFHQHRLAEEMDGLHLGQVDRPLFDTLVSGCVSMQGDLDDMLAAVLDEDWPVERVERLLLIVLRAGAYELSTMPETPARVVISEYLDLAHAFFGGKEPAMVNGVLDRLARHLRIEEFEGGSPALLS